ncbi:MAG TPA: hypothetical protein VF505_16270 [Thermoanaerobaculia bacterium]
MTIKIDRPMRFVIGSCLATLIFSSNAAAQSNPTGNWNGTYTLTLQVSSCSNKTFTSSGNVTATFLETGTSLAGRIDLTNVVLPNSNCVATTSEVTSAVVGTVSGSSIAWSIPNSSNGTHFNGSIVGNSIVTQISDGNGGTGSLTMTRTSGDAPAVDLTGTWSGTYSFTDRCSNGKTQIYTGAMTIGLTQSGSDAGGVLTMQNVPLYDQNCSKITTLNMALEATGTVSGSTWTGGVFDPSGSFEFPITATINAAAMSGTVSGANGTTTTGTFSLTRSTTTAPVADLAGSYDGSYSETDNETSTCINFGALTFSGPASLSIVQAGTAISGSLIFHGAQDVSSDGFGDCFVVDVGDEVLPIYGSLTATNTLTLILPVGGGAVDQFVLTFSGGAVTGTIADSFGDAATFTATKSTSAAPPVINTFAATPTSIVTGESSTLSWSVSNATTVSIDNGLGAEPVSGSVTVSPSQTTIYTLTATDDAGSVSAQTTITVVPPGPKRRAVHR